MLAMSEFIPGVSMFRSFVAATVVLPLSCTASLAADPPQSPPPAPAAPSEPDWTVDVGPGAIAAPRFPGAKKIRALPVPFVDVRYRDWAFFSVRDGLGVNLLRWNGLKIGPVLQVAFPRRYEDDRGYLTGLTNVDTTLEAGAFISYTLDPYFTTKLELRKGVASLGSSRRNPFLTATGTFQKSNQHDGVVVDWSADFNAPPLFGNRLFLSAGPRASYYDKRYAKAYFGVTPAESAVSSFRRFEPKGGFGKVGVGLGAAYPINDNLTFVAAAEYGRLVGDVAKSPIVRGRDGSRDQYMLANGLTYRFKL